MSRFFAIVTLFALLCVAYAPPASANTIYMYGGNPFTDFFGTLPAGVERIDGSFTLANPLPANLPLTLLTPLSWSFTDLATTVTQASLGLGFHFELSTNATGDIIGWYVSVVGPAPGGIVRLDTVSALFDRTTYSPDLSSPLTGTADYLNFASGPGAWFSSSSTVVTPEPASLILLGSGLLGVLGAARRKLRG